MNKNRFARRLAVTAGFFYLCAAPGLTRAQSSPPGPAPTPHKAAPAAAPKRDTAPADEFGGLTFTDEQKSRIDQIHQNTKSQMEKVVQNGKLTAEQRDAMLAAYRRSERSQVFKVLTSAQQKEVLRRARARHAAEQQSSLNSK